MKNWETVIWHIILKDGIKLKILSKVKPPLQVKKYQKETVLLSFLPKILISAVEEARAESVKDFCFEWENGNFLLKFFDL